MHSLRERRVDLDGDGAVLSDFGFAFDDDFGRLGIATPPDRIRPSTAPRTPAGIPGVVAGEPPVASAVEPIPTRGRIPSAAVIGPQDFVFDLGLRDCSAEVVVGFDRRRDLVAECDWFLRSLDLHLEFGLLVLLNAERAAAVTGGDEMPHSQRSVFRQLVITGEAAKRIGIHRPSEDHFPFRVS